MNQNLTEYQEPFAFSSQNLAPLNSIFPPLKHESRFLLLLFSLGDGA